MKAAGSQRGAPHLAHREREVRISQSHIGGAPSTTEHVPTRQLLVAVGEL
jgi:hypothetical protein